MNMQRNNLQRFLLFFSILMVTTICAEYAHIVAFTPHFLHETYDKSFQDNKSHDDFFHNKSWDYHGTTHKLPFQNYTAQDFKDHFVVHGDTETRILNQRCLYMFDEFVKFAQTYPGYNNAIKNIYMHH